MCKWESTEKWFKRGRAGIIYKMLGWILDVNSIDWWYGTPWCISFGCTKSLPPNWYAIRQTDNVTHKSWVCGYHMWGQSWIQTLC